MTTTPVSLLQRLRRSPARQDWDRLIELYTPLLYYWARRVGLQQADAADLVQDVLVVLVRKLPEWDYDPRKSFRNWLRTITLNRWRESVRRHKGDPVDPAAPVLAELPAPDDGNLLGEEEYRTQLVKRALELMRTTFQPATWQACWEVVVNGRPAQEVGRQFGLSLAAVYAAKSRVLRRLRQELEGLLD